MLVVSLASVCTLSISSQKSVEDPGAVTCESSTYMFICKSSRQSVLRCTRSVCGSVKLMPVSSACTDTRFVHISRGPWEAWLAAQARASH